MGALIYFAILGFYLWTLILALFSGNILWFFVVLILGGFFMSIIGSFFENA